jgi:hypothetical protein
MHLNLSMRAVGRSLETRRLNCHDASTEPCGPSAQQAGTDRNVRAAVCGSWGHSPSSTQQATTTITVAISIQFLIGYPLPTNH